MLIKLTLAASNHTIWLNPDHIISATQRVTEWENELIAGTRLSVTGGQIIEIAEDLAAVIKAANQSPA